MLIRAEGRDDIFFGDSLYDVQEWLKANPSKWTLGIQSAEQNGLGHMNRASWDLGAGVWSNVARMCRDGWEEGVEKLHTGLRALAPPTTKHAVLRHDIAGHLADVPRFLSGAPDSMITRGKRKGAKPVINVVVNSIPHGGTEAKCFMNFGIAAASAVDKLESSGRRVELDMLYCFGKKTGGEARVGWKIKSAGDHMDLAAVAFSLAHPASLRRVAFAMVERTAAANSTSGYGSCENLTAKKASCIAPEDALIISGSGNELASHCKTPESAVMFFAQQINKAAGETLVELDQ